MMVFGKDVGDPEWSVDRRKIKKISTKFDIHKNCLIVKLHYRFGSFRFALPAQGNQLFVILQIFCQCG
jgi:hypothetical protein